MLDHVAGSELNPGCELTEDGVPPPVQQRSRNLSVPDGASAAIQYAVPAVTGAPVVSATVFHAPQPAS